MLRLLHVSRFLSSHVGLTLIEKRGGWAEIFLLRAKGHFCPLLSVLPPDRKGRRREGKCVLLLGEQRVSKILEVLLFG